MNLYVVRRSSPGLGLGLFAAQNFAEGQMVLEYCGRRTAAKVADKLRTRYLLELDDTLVIDGSSRMNVARYINHSCEPNCEGRLSEGRVFVYAARDIKKGKEFTLDYGDEYFNQFIRPHGCKCTKCIRSDEMTQTILRGILSA